MAEQFAAGDIVVLKSGGPNMTISRFETLNNSQHAVCTWFTTDGKKEVSTFSVAALKRGGV
ncbi:MAG: DUF2158 domain-containing protein [Candidatus Acidiferrales bacterium]